MGMRGSFPIAGELEGAQLWWPYRFPECPATQAIASQAEGIQKLPRCGCRGLRV